jgi:hypothetical protein
MKFGGFISFYQIINGLGTQSEVSLWKRLITFELDTVFEEWYSLQKSVISKVTLNGRIIIWTSERDYNTGLLFFVSIWISCLISVALFLEVKCAYDKILLIF